MTELKQSLRQYKVRLDSEQIMKNKFLWIGIIALLLAIVIAVLFSGRACGDVGGAAEILTSISNVRLEIEKRIQRGDGPEVNAGLNIASWLKRQYVITNGGTIVVTKGNVVLVFEPIKINGGVGWNCYGHPQAIRGILEASKCFVKD